MSTSFIKFSVCDMLKKGIGSSSSHTLAPWRSAQACYDTINKGGWLSELTEIKVTVYGSLGFVGRGHYTSIAIPLGLLNKDVMTFDVSAGLEAALGITSVIYIEKVNSLKYSDTQTVAYTLIYNIDDHKDKERMDFAFTYKSVAGGDGRPDLLTYYSYGGGSYGTAETLQPAYSNLDSLPYMYDSAATLQGQLNSLSISDAIFENELAYATYRKTYPDGMEGLPTDKTGIITYLKDIAVQMGVLIYDGCTYDDSDNCYEIMYAKPRAKSLYNKLIGQDAGVQNWQTFFQQLYEKSRNFTFEQITELVSIFALAVSEQNAALKHVVTAPTNGSCGTVPAVLYYYILFHASAEERDWLYGNSSGDELNGILRFLITASTVGGIVKNNANISGGVGGCQAEVGTSGAMAAGALADILGNFDSTVTFNAAEAALQEQLGSTCDPIGGLVELPCIDRNLAASITAITLSREMTQLGNSFESTVPFDKCVAAMANISANMSTLYQQFPLYFKIIN